MGMLPTSTTTTAAKAQPSRGHQTRSSVARIRNDSASLLLWSLLSWSAGSQVCGNRVIDIAAQLWSVEDRQMPPPLEELMCAQGWAPQLPQLRHRLAVTGDHDLLPGGDPIEDVAPVVAELSLGHVTHANERDTASDIRARRTPGLFRTLPGIGPAVCGPTGRGSAPGGLVPVVDSPYAVTWRAMDPDVLATAS